MTDSQYVAYDKATIHAHESYQVILRAIHCRGERQALALAEMARRGLWLSAEQKLESVK